jgi:hypothetical protein
MAGRRKPELVSSVRGHGPTNRDGIAPGLDRLERLGGGVIIE